MSLFVVPILTVKKNEKNETKRKKIRFYRVATNRFLFGVSNSAPNNKFNISNYDTMITTINNIYNNNNNDNNNGNLSKRFEAFGLPGTCEKKTVCLAPCLMRLLCQNEYEFLRTVDPDRPIIIREFSKTKFRIDCVCACDPCYPGILGDFP